MEDKYDLLKCAAQKSIVKEFENGETVLLSCPIWKFNDYKKKQQRNFLISTHGVYNLKGTDIKRKINVSTIKAISVSKIANEFIIHVPSEYDYRYASEDCRDKIIYYLLKACRLKTSEKIPIYYRDQINLAMYAMTKEDKKKYGSKELKGKFILHDDESFKRFLQEWEEEKQVVRKTTKTLFAKGKQDISINDFIPKAVLGKGAFGTVLLVEKKDSKQIFAMKSIFKDDIIKKNQLEHTKTQKIILEHVNHPFLVNLAYAFQTPQKLYFIMQFMRGGQLFQHLAKAKKFPEKQAQFYAMQISYALGHLHQKDFIYRDLKLENILMDQNGNVSLTDFGMAKMIRDGEMTTTFCGTPEYLAPQVLEGQGYDKSADWWSLGILTFEMMYGLPPFYHKSQEQMFEKIKLGQFKFSDKVKVSNDAKDFIVKLLKANPKERLGTKDEANEILSHPWFKDIDKQKVLSKQITPPYKPDCENFLDNFDEEFTSEKAAYDDKGERVDRDRGEMDKLFKGF